LTTGIGTGTVVGAVGGGALAVADCASRGGTARQCAEAGAVGTVVGAAGGAVITVAVNAAAQGTATGIVAAGGSAAAGAVGGTLVVGTVMIAGGYQTGKAIGNIIVQARSDSPQQIRGSDAAMAEADRRLTEVYELRKQFTDEAAALANETKKVTGLRDECAKLFAPAAASSLLPTGEAAEALNHLSENCTKAQTDLEALTTAGSDTLKIGQQASQMMATKEGPPESTETMRKVRGLIVSIRDTQLLTIDTAARGVANDLKPLAARLKAVTQYQDKEKELNQKVTAYDQATTGLQEKNGYVDGLRKRFDDAKANALAVLSPLEAQVVERDKARFADRLARIGKAEVGGEAQGQLSAAVAVVSSSDADKQNFKSAVSSAFRDAHSQWENETCAKFSAENGLANAGKAAQQSVEDVRSLLANLVAAFKERKQKLLQITKIDQETLAKGKTLLETEGDDAKRKIIENKMTNARDRKASVETENGELTLGQQDAEKAEQKAQATVTLLNVGGN
jgi:hypothetical protein